MALTLDLSSPIAAARGSKLSDLSLDNWDGRKRAGNPGSGAADLGFAGLKDTLQASSWKAEK